MRIPSKGEIVRTDTASVEIVIASSDSVRLKLDIDGDPTGSLVRWRGPPPPTAGVVAPKTAAQEGGAGRSYAADTDALRCEGYHP